MSPPVAGPTEMVGAGSLRDRLTIGKPPAPDVSARIDPVEDALSPRS